MVETLIMFLHMFIIISVFLLLTVFALILFIIFMLSK